MRELHFVCCTQGRKEDSILARSLYKLGTHQLSIFESTAHRYASCYNYVLKSHAKPDSIIVFVRDDVLIGDAYIQEKLNQAVDTLGFAVAGVAGAATFNFDESQPSTSWKQVPPANLSGALEYTGIGMQSTWQSFGPAPARCITLDEALLAVDPRKIGELRFDEHFESQFLELDFCLTAHFAGVRLGTMNVYVNRKPEILPTHPRFLAAQRAFRAKWRVRLKQQCEQTKAERLTL